MALELPGEVVQLLQFIGINFPQCNEDKVREFASHVRDFAANLEDTHSQASSTIRQVGQAYSGQSYELLVSKWAHLSQGHMTVLIDACHVLASALDVAADVIVGMKTEAIAELVVLAASFIADQAAAVATFGIAEAAIALIEEAAEKVVDFLTQQLIQYITGMVIEAALKPLLGLIDKAVSGMTYGALEDLLGVSGGSAGTGFGVDADALSRHAETFRGHAETVAGHAQDFAGKVAGLSFT